MKHNNKKNGAKYSFAPFTKKLTINFHRLYKDYKETEKRLQHSDCKCHLCGKSIANITESFMDNNGNYLHFDCVYNEVKKTFPQSNNSKLIYSGNGRFSLIKKTPEGNFILESTINYEDKESNKNIKTNIEQLKKWKILK